MCGRYAWGQKIPLPHPKNLPLPPPPPSVSYNRAPGQKHPIVIQGEKKSKKGSKKRKGSKKKKSKRGGAIKNKQYGGYIRYDDEFNLF